MDVRVDLHHACCPIHDNDSSGTKELGWTEFQKLAQENVFDKMTVYNKKNLVEATVKNGKTEQVFGNMDVSKIGVSPKVYVKIPSADKFPISMTKR